jgi:hypothetical protein
MRRAGKSEHVICKAAGWRTTSMFRRYDIVDEADLAELFEDTSTFVAEREKQPRKVEALSDARAKRVATAGL